MHSPAHQPLPLPSQPQASSSGPQKTAVESTKPSAVPHTSDGGWSWPGAVMGPGVLSKGAPEPRSSGTLSCPHPPRTSPSLRFQVNLAPLRRWKGRRPVWVVVGMWAQGLWPLSKARLAPGRCWWPFPDLATVGVSVAGTDPAASPGRFCFDPDPERQVQSHPHFADEHSEVQGGEKSSPGPCGRSQTQDRMLCPLRDPRWNFTTQSTSWDQLPRHPGGPPAGGSPP